MKRFFLALLVAALPLAMAAADTLSDLQSEINSQLADNTTRSISPAKLRGVLSDMSNKLFRKGYSVVNYGAVANSTGFTVGTDSRAAFQAAFNAAAADCSNVYVPAGKYRLSSSVTLNLSGITGTDSCRPSLIGDGSGDTILYFDNGNFSPIVILGSASHLDLFMTISGLKIRKADNLGQCVGIAYASYIYVHDLTTQGCQFGLLGSSVLNSLIDKSLFLGNVYGVYMANAGGSSTPNAVTVLSSVFGNNLENGLYVLNPTTLKVIGGSFEANGYQGATNGTTTLRGGLAIDGSPLAGGASISVDGAYFELNAGAADIAINTSGGVAGHQATYSVRDSTFNRIDSTHFVTNNIQVTGTTPAILRYEGNTFMNAGSYVANAARQHVAFPAVTSPLDLGNFYDDPATEGTNTASYDPLSAWVAYTPTMGCISGALTTASATGNYKRIGKTVFVRMRVTITAVGTCTYPTATLPLAPLADDTMSGRENATTGKAIQGQMTAGALPVRISNYDDSQPATPGSAIFNLKSTYEAQ